MLLERFDTGRVSQALLFPCPRVNVIDRAIDVRESKCDHIAKNSTKLSFLVRISNSTNVCFLCPHLHMSSIASFSFTVEVD